VAYLMIEDFKRGMDLRRSATTAEAGSLRLLRNGFITPGGEIEKRKTLTSIGTLPAGKTFGLGFQGTNLVVFGTDTPGVIGGLPSYVSYAQLTPSNAVTVSEVLDVQNFGPNQYVVALMSDASVRHFYNGAEVAITGTNIRTHQQKMYAVDGVNLRFSAIGDPTDWTNATGVGAGVIDTSTMDAPSTDLVGLERYYSFLAVFGRTFVQIWGMDPDPTKDALLQTMNNIGLVAPHAAAGYGNGDVLFLSDTGIRSIRARDASNAASLSDVGAPIDVYVANKRANITRAEAKKIRALVDPLTGHFWMVWGSEVLVLSLNPNGGVSAWSVFDFSTSIDDVVVANSRIAVRVQDELFVYGSVSPGDNPFDPNTPVGDTAALYDQSVVEVETPYLDAGRPATTKQWTGLDMSCQGTWAVQVNPDLYTPGLWTTVGVITRDTWGEGRIPLDLTGTHMALRLVSSGAGMATIANLALHFASGDES